MKTIEQKAEAYERALEKAKDALKDGTISQNAIAYLQDIFPELKESEDEKMRKKLIAYFKNLSDVYSLEPLEINPKKVIAWLEKQGEQKYNLSIDNSYANTNFPFTAVVKSSNKLVNIISGQLNSDCKYYIKYQSDKADKYRIYEPDELVEQKPAENVEPKFKVGEWITNGDYTWKIVEVKSLDYILQSQDGNIVDDTISYVDNNFHIWTIKDAKDGDVLVTIDDERPFIYKGCLDPNHPDSPVAYCGIDSEDYFICSCIDKFNRWWTGEKVLPATKEQREILLKAMADAWYTFDFEKKNVKKIEVKPNMIQWRGDNLKEIIEFTGKDKNFDKWFKSFAEYEKYVSEHDHVFKLFNADGSHFEVPVGAWIVKTPDGYNVASKAIFKNKPAEWSEEDEMIALSIEQIMNRASLLYIVPEKKDKIRTWLKSLKEKYTWKPTEEQIKALHNLNLTGDISYMGQGQTLLELYNDLKKL